MMQISDCLAQNNSLLASTNTLLADDEFAATLRREFLDKRLARQEFWGPSDSLSLQIEKNTL
jgi:hypothetical protein